MFCLDWLQAGRATRGKPRPERHWCRSLARPGITRLPRFVAKRMSIRAVQPNAATAAGSSARAASSAAISARVFNRTTGLPIAVSPESSAMAPSWTPYPRPSSLRAWFRAIHPEHASSNPPGSTDSSTELGPAGPVDPTAKSKVVTPPGQRGISHRTSGGELPDSRPGFRNTNRTPAQ